MQHDFSAALQQLHCVSPVRAGWHQRSPRAGRCRDPAAPDFDVSSPVPPLATAAAVNTDGLSFALPGGNSRAGRAVLCCPGGWPVPTGTPSGGSGCGLSQLLGLLLLLQNFFPLPLHCLQQGCTVLETQLYFGVPERPCPLRAPAPAPGAGRSGTPGSPSPDNTLVPGMHGRPLALSHLRPGYLQRCLLSRLHLHPISPLAHVRTVRPCVCSRRVLV